MAAPRWLLALTFTALPWAGGSAAPGVLRGLELAAALAGGLWLAGSAVRRRLPRVGALDLVLVVWLLVQGWGMAANAHYAHDPQAWRFTAVPARWEGGPGSVDGAVSVAAMRRVTALLVLLLLTVDVARNRCWRGRLRWTLVLAAFAVVVFGLVQRALGAPAIFWRGEPATGPFFATFYYAANAGTFLNLGVPLAVGLALVSGQPGRVGGWQRPVALLAAAVSVAGGAVNASRAALVILGVSALAMAAWGGWQWSRGRRTTGRRRGDGVLAAAAVLALALLVGSVGTDVAREKWALLPTQLHGDNPRWLAMAAGARMLPDAGAWGFGPGTFGLAFPHYTHFLGDRIPGIWRYAHNDYLQTVLEWGWVGALAWGGLFFVNLGRAFVRAFDRDVAERERTLAFATAVALTGAALHAAVDFPWQVAPLQLDVLGLLGLAAAATAGGRATRGAARAGSRGARRNPPRSSRGEWRGGAPRS